MLLRRLGSSVRLLRGALLCPVSCVRLLRAGGLHRRVCLGWLVGVIQSSILPVWRVTPPALWPALGPHLHLYLARALQRVPRHFPLRGLRAKDLSRSRLSLLGPCPAAGAPPRSAVGFQVAGIAPPPLTPLGCRIPPKVGQVAAGPLRFGRAVVRVPQGGSVRASRVWVRVWLVLLLGSRLPASVLLLFLLVQGQKYHYSGGDVLMKYRNLHQAHYF